MKFKNIPILFLVTVFCNISFANNINENIDITVGSIGGTGGPKFPTNGSVVDPTIANGGGGTGVPVLPTNGSILSPNIANGSGGGFLTKASVPTLLDSLINSPVKDILSEVGTAPVTLDLSSRLISKASVLGIEREGYNKLIIVKENKPVYGASENTISILGAVETFSEIKEWAQTSGAKSLFKDYAKKVESGVIDTLYVTDDEDKIILIDSSKIK